MKRISSVIPVNCLGGSYEVHVGRDLLESLGAELSRLVSGNKVHIITDTCVLPLYAKQMRVSLKEQGFETSGSVFSAGEASKNVEVWAAALEEMAAAELTRSDCVVALGGGVVGDLAGFVAASYMRGIPFVQVPTTLLSMVDASVGGKTAIDLERGKNLVGAFHQPKLVLADVNTLKSLDEHQFADACGEIIKHAVLADGELFESISELPLTERSLDDYELDNIIARNIEIKRDVVEMDEKEQGMRMLLNLGHTIGHAIEAASNYELGHGDCVAAGMCCMARATEALGWSSVTYTAKLCDCVEKHGLSTSTDVSADVLYNFIVLDKKRRSNSINIVLAHDIEDCEIKSISLHEMREILELGCK